MPCCGPKLSLCGIILSTWGVIQLGLMGVFYITGSVALAEDIPAVEFNGNLTEFYNEVDSGFKQIFGDWLFFQDPLLLFSKGTHYNSPYRHSNLRSYLDNIATRIHANPIKRTMAKNCRTLLEIVKFI